MCDEFTLEAEQAAVSRRSFTMLGAAAVAAGCMGTAVSGAAKAAMTERTVIVPTADGMADCLFIHPAKGKFPGVIMWPDIGGAREAFFEMGRRMAANGFAVLVVNHYYRGGKAPLLASFAEWRTPEGQAKLRPIIAQLNNDTITRDARAFVEFLDKQPAVNARRKIGNLGYCMTGSYTVRAAAAMPDRIGAAASCHGGGLVSDRPDSPHRLLAQTKASYIFAIARNDDARAPGDKEVLRTAAAAAGRPAEVEVYAADHGWCVLDSAVYHKAEADRAWARIVALFKKL